MALPVGSRLVVLLACSAAVGGWLATAAQGPALKQASGPAQTPDPGTFFARSPSGGWTSLSDARIKCDILTVPATNLLDAALRLRPVQYHFNSERNLGAMPTQPHLGLLAQEVQAVVPDLVTASAGLLTVNYAGLSVVAIGGLQEQQRQIESLRSENSDLRGKITRLHERLQYLERLARLPSDPPPIYHVPSHTNPAAHPSTVPGTHPSPTAPSRPTPAPTPGRLNPSGTPLTPATPGQPTPYGPAPDPRPGR